MSLSLALLASLTGAAAPSAAELPEYPTLRIPLGRQAQVVHLLENRFCASDCAVAHDLISGWYRIDQGAPDSIAGFTPFFHARAEEYFFSDQVDLQSLLPKKVAQATSLDTTGEGTRNVPAGPSRVCNSVGGIYELFAGQLNYLAPAPWPADETTQVGCEINQAYAYRPGELRRYDGGQWKLEILLEEGPGSVHGNGDFATVDGSGEEARLRIFKRNTLGYWFQTDTYTGAEVNGLSHVRWSDNWVVANDQGRHWCVLQREDDFLEPVLEWQQPEGSNDFQWMHFNESNQEFSLIELVEPEEIDLVRLEADTEEVSAQFGGGQGLIARFPSSYNGAIFFTLGSCSGTEPGILYSTQLIGLNPDVYFEFLLGSPEASPLMGQTGKLDSLGRAFMELDLSGGWIPGIELVGYEVHHVVLAFNDLPGGLDLIDVTPPARLQLVP